MLCLTLIRRIEGGGQGILPLIIMSTKNSAIRKKRMAGYFIDAYNQLAEEDTPITIRSLAECAGFNSATIYSYFENLEHVQAYALLRLSSNIWTEASRLNKEENRPLMRFFNIWQAVCFVAFHQPRMFSCLLTHTNQAYIYEFVDGYMELFEEEYQGYDDMMKSIIHCRSVRERGLAYIRPCVENGTFTAAEAVQIFDCGTMLICGAVYQTLWYPDADIEHYRQLFFDGFLTIVKKRLLKDEDVFDEFYVKVLGSS